MRATPRGARSAAVLAAIVLAGAPGRTGAAEPAPEPSPAAVQRLALFVHRTGPFAAEGSAFANGFRDYVALVNRRDGGIGEVALRYEECETGYSTLRGLECYEQLFVRAAEPPGLVLPDTAGLVRQLIARVAKREVPVLSVGFGAAMLGDGRIFRWSFIPPASPAAIATALIARLGAREHGLDKLRGKRVGLVFERTAFSAEAARIFDILARAYGFDLSAHAVRQPGTGQAALWARIAEDPPDWMMVWGRGPMARAALEGAAAVEFPAERIIGGGSLLDAVAGAPRAAARDGYLAAVFHGLGPHYPVLGAIARILYPGRPEPAARSGWGEKHYNHGLLSAMLSVEAIRTALRRWGAAPLSGAQIRWGLEHLVLEAARLRELGFDDFIAPLRLDCADHEGAGRVRFVRWSAGRWVPVSPWEAPMRGVVRPLAVRAARAYATSHRMAAHDCAAPGGREPGQETGPEVGE